MKDRETRVKANQRIIIKDGSSSYSAAITTISKTGMSIKADHAFPTYKVIDVVVKIAKKFVQIKASVRWVHECSDDSGGKWYEIGLSLPNPPPEYTEHFE
jgi:Tfp pilus assembly protein PilZ